ncbi:hypothetical protein CHH28_02800 [Bacterioplanes sanyensis]|uniref:Twin-arginine translocation pathway signal protein n=1 Tax=Bacterioplanes sanyensis TaxID=1249553 RepID=A0A222FHE8_9GAMM|nr:twin-arginine translocation signal domain-containing protein [Bacterioplanes sanyensis]ASP37663.1 hypothetical protein CHH28_02800 [Bacterioplanes sanyensis]
MLNTTRRGFMQLSGGAAATLTLGSSLALLSGCSRQPEAGLQFLTADDADFLAALAPVIMGASYPGQLGPEQARARQVAALDKLIGTLQYHSRNQLVQLLAIMSSAPLRAALGAPFRHWNEASAEEVEAFLLGWRDSSLQVKRMGYASLCKLQTMCWYALPENYIASGYPGPPQKIPTVVSQ